MRTDTGFERIATERLVLRRSMPEDAERIASYRSDPDVHRFQGWDRTDADGIRAEIVEMARHRPGEPGWVQLSVVDAVTGELVGDVGLSPAVGEPGVMKLGYTIAPEFQRRGYATEAVRALVEYAFEVLGADVVRIYADGDNVASHRVAEKSGLRLVERFRHEEDGEAWFGVRYELSREERSATSGERDG
jgi:RimJ/RimL family protein N-acetyltransferase